MQFENPEDYKEYREVTRMFPEFLTKMTKQEKFHKHQFVREACVMQATLKGARHGVIEVTKHIHSKGLTVDHIVPLWGTNERGEHIVCGLNVSWNLRGETKKDNCKKGSNFVDNADAIGIIIPPRQKSA